MNWLKNFFSHYVLYIVLLLVLCLGIFPFVILYAASKLIAASLDRFFPNKNLAAKVEKVWDVIGTPYDYLVKTVG